MKRKHCSSAMGMPIHVSGFPSISTSHIARQYFGIFTGERSLDASKWMQYQNKARRIWYDDHYYLNTKMMGPGAILTTSSNYDVSLEKMELNFGCQVSDVRFAVLWKGQGIKLNSDFGVKNLCFEFCYDNVYYKMHLSQVVDVGKIQLRRPRGSRSYYLLIKLDAAPKIYEKIAFFSLSRDGYAMIHSLGICLDDRWVRSTDFTSSGLIGQSSALCLKVPAKEWLIYFKEFHFLEEKDGPFVLQVGNPYSRNPLAPIVSLPKVVHLPFDILYKVNLLVQKGCLAGPNLDFIFYWLLDPENTDTCFVEFCLQKLYDQTECCYDPVSWLTRQYWNYTTSKRPPQGPALSLYAGLVYVRRVLVTPCKVYFCDPQLIVSNHVLRSYLDDIDNFLRVSFVDEDLERLNSFDLSTRVSSLLEDRRTNIYRRILSTLRNGIVIGDKHFEFLAFSASQLRENSLWMFASRPGLSAADIRRRLGDFSKIRNVAKYAARLGQSLSSSKETLSVERHEIEIIPDVTSCNEKNEYIFSDGIGKISTEFALEVAKKFFSGKFPSFTVPSTFQIRYGGYKGVVAIDPKTKHKLSLRKSMCKYESNVVKLDVLAYSKYQPCYLNRQLITLLSTLGVSDLIFEEKQREFMKPLDDILTDPAVACEALHLMPHGEHTNILKEMLGCGYKPDSEPFLKMMLQNFLSFKLLELRTKSRIFIPEGRALMGCLDETRTLEYGQVFLQVSNPRNGNLSNVCFRPKTRMLNGHRSVITGRVIIAKNPCLHPGDIRVLTAIDVPDLHHLVDCVVFPQKGNRPHPNECSGSDLDGDVYFVCWDPDLIPSLQVEPMEYTPAPPKVLDHEVTIEEIQDYFANYMVKDNLGIISNAHLAFADMEKDKAMSGPCTELAQIFSIAVDYPKTGVPVVMPSHLHVKKFPDFMEKSDNKPSYESINVIGKLYRAVKDKPSLTIDAFTLEVARRSYDRNMEYPGFKDYVKEAIHRKREYDLKLGDLMHYYGVKTKAEILSGNILEVSRLVNRRKEINKRKEADAVCMDVKALRIEARSWFDENTTRDNNPHAKASAWYHVTYHPDYYNEGRDHYISFAWCVYDILIEIKKNCNLVSPDLRPLYDHFR